MKHDNVLKYIYTLLLKLSLTKKKIRMKNIITQQRKDPYDDT